MGKELDIIDQNENLDISGMVQSVERGEWGEFPDQWLKEQHIKDCRTCATFADSIPKTVFEECAYGEKWGRIMMFFQCEKDTKYKTCMNHDMKLKLEKSFGSLESLEEATGLPEYQLLPMTMKLLNEQMDICLHFIPKILYDYTIKILMKSFSYPHLMFNSNYNALKFMPPLIGFSMF